MKFLKHETHACLLPSVIKASVYSTKLESQCYQTRCRPLQIKTKFQESKNTPEYN